MMRTRSRNTNGTGYTNRRGDDALTLAVRLTLNQLSQGIPVAEAVQFAAKYHNVTCAAIQQKLSKTTLGFVNTGLF